jgi:hypothetical protein
VERWKEVLFSIDHQVLKSLKSPTATIVDGHKLKETKLPESRASIIAIAVLDIVNIQFDMIHFGWQ